MRGYRQDGTKLGFQPGGRPWNSGLTGLNIGTKKGSKLSALHQSKIGEGLRSSDRVHRQTDPQRGILYSSIHNFIRRKKGRASKCTNLSCSKKSVRFEWALLRNHDAFLLDSYIEMCVSCHREYDMTEETRRKLVEARPAAIELRRSRGWIYKNKKII